ncbi:MAG: DNA-3-methyladenine glycosylase I [Chlorobiaceae bacterium]|nr:DNA-3-methyladenine glycosylase I [Chlorobiaceae bacterium]
MDMKRCSWAESSQMEIAYHDEEWGVPVHDDWKHFEMLILEGAQAGLSWKTVLQKREAYRKAFHQFDHVKVASMTDDELEEQLKNPGIVRNRLKVYAARKNALVFLDIQKEFGSFDAYVRQFTEVGPVDGKRINMADVPAKSAESDALSKDLKKRGMSFVGSIIIYAYMQAVGLVNDHLVSCFRYPDVMKLH